MLIPISDKFTQRANGPMKEYSVSVGSCFSDVFQKILFFDRALVLLCNTWKSASSAICTREINLEQPLSILYDVIINRITDYQLKQDISSLKWKLCLKIFRCCGNVCNQTWTLMSLNNSHWSGQTGQFRCISFNQITILHHYVNRQYRIQ